MLIFMVFNAIKSHFRPIISYFSAIFLDISFLFFEAQNIYFVPNCIGQPDFILPDLAWFPDFQSDRFFFIIFISDNICGNQCFLMYIS